MEFEMDTEKRFYIFGVILTAMGIYKGYTGDPQEALLYLGAAVAFSTTGLSTRKDLDKGIKKIVSIASWVSIGITAMIFFYLVRSEAYF